MRPDFSTPLTILLPRLLAHLQAESAWARTRLLPFAGRCAQISVGAAVVHLRVGADGSLLAAEPDTPVAVCLQLPPPDAGLLSLGLASWIGRAEIQGNADFAENLGFVLRHLRWDVEADLARILGDIPAHRLALTGTAVGRALRTVATQASDQLRSASGLLLVDRPTLTAHADAVAELRRRLAALQLRLD